MKKAFSILFFAILFIAKAQNSGIQSDNTFNKSERGIENANNTNANGFGEAGKGPGNPGDPLPINQYVPILILVGVALMTSVKYKKKTT